MAVYSYYQQSLSYPAATERKMFRALLRGPDGILFDTGSPLLVQAQGTPNMSVRVNAGSAKQNGEYLGVSDAVKNVTIDTASASNPRIDLIVMKWRDTENGDPVSDCDIVAIKGTPAASPTVPSTTGMVVVKLAQVFVAAGTTSIAASAVTDQRTYNTPPQLMQMGKATLPRGSAAVGAAKSVTVSLDPAIFGGAAPSNVQLSGTDAYGSWFTFNVESVAANQFTVTAQNVTSGSFSDPVAISFFWIAYK